MYAGGHRVVRAALAIVGLRALARGHPLCRLNLLCECKNAIVHVLELLHVWGGAAFFVALKEGAGELDRNFGIHSEIFASFYPRLAFELHSGKLPLAFGSQEHMEETYQRAMSSWPLLNKGVRSKSGRWFQVFEKEGANLPFWGGGGGHGLDLLGLHRRLGLPGRGG